MIRRSDTVVAEEIKEEPTEDTTSNEPETKPAEDNERGGKAGKKSEIKETDAKADRKSSDAKRKSKKARDESEDAPEPPEDATEDKRPRKDTAEDEEGDEKQPEADTREETRTQRPPSSSHRFDDRERPGDWVPKTRLGRMVKNGEITTMAQAIETGYPLREPEIVDILLPDLDDEVLDVNMVQRMTDSGRRVRFAIMTVVGNEDGYVGLGKATGKEVGPAIRKAIDNAKLNIIEIKRGCGSWECGCGQPHSLPFMVVGKSGSAEVTFKPAPRGISLAVGDVAKHILRLAGISDSWGFTEGKTRTTVNYAKAAFDALRKTAEMRVMPEQEVRLHIRKGAIGKVMEKAGEDE